MFFKKFTQPTQLPTIPSAPEQAPFWITPFLWDLLKRPMRWHPLYKHHARPNWSVPASDIDDIYKVGCGALVLIIVMLYVLFPLEAFVTTVILLMLSPVLFIVFSSTVAGTQWAMEVSAAVAVEQRRGRYALMSLTPRGGLGIRWIIGIAHMHRGDRLTRTNQLTRSLAIAGVVALGLFCLVTVTLFVTDELSPRIMQTGDSLIRLLLPAVTLGLLVWIDTQQSAVLSCLTGMITPSAVLDAMQVRLLAAGSFLLLQLGSYIVAAGLGVTLYIVVTTLLGDTVIALFLSLLGSVGIFVVLREILVRVVWEAALWHFNTHTGEFYNMARI